MQYKILPPLAKAALVSRVSQRLCCGTLKQAPAVDDSVAGAADVADTDRRMHSLATHQACLLQKDARDAASTLIRAATLVPWPPYASSSATLVMPAHPGLQMPPAAANPPGVCSNRQHRVQQSRRFRHTQADHATAGTGGAACHPRGRAGADPNPWALHNRPALAQQSPACGAQQAMGLRRRSRSGRGALLGLSLVQRLLR
jgi:hypothetical protein